MSINDNITNGGSMSINDNITNLLKCNNITEEELANELSISEEDIINWKNNKSEPSIKELKLLSKRFSISIDELVGNNKYVSSDKKVFYVGYEYRSKKTIKNIPLIHINVGKGKKARGIIAIGNNAKGIISIGGKSVGLFSVGGLSLGLISIGGIGIGIFSIAGIALALLMSIGGISIAPFAVGGIAIGILTLGGISIGNYSIGGISIGKYVSIGGYANGHIAIGYHVNGNITPIKPTSNELRRLILDNYPNTWKFVIDFMCSFLGR